MGGTSGSFNSSTGGTGKSSGGYGMTPSTMDNPYGTGDNTGASVQGGLTYNNQPVDNMGGTGEIALHTGESALRTGGAMPPYASIGYDLQRPMMNPNQARFDMRQQNRQMRFNNLPPEQQAQRQDQFMANQQNRYNRFQARNMPMPSPGGKGGPSGVYNQYQNAMVNTPTQLYNPQNMFDY